jgi:hypothetical protein
MEVRVWEWQLSTVLDDPERIRLWIEVCTSQRWDESGVLLHLSYAEWVAARQRLDQLGGPPLRTPRPQAR